MELILTVLGVLGVEMGEESIEPLYTHFNFENGNV